MSALEVDVSDEEVAHRAFELALITDEPLILFRRRSFLRWEATMWEAERVSTVAATYTYARLVKIGMGATQALARRHLR